MKRLFIPLLFGLICGGCAHTNELMKYDLNGKNAYFEEFVSSQANVIQVEINTSEKKKDEKDSEKKSDSESILDAVVSVGSAILTAEKISDIEESVDTYELITSVSDGFKETLETYVNINSIDNKREADFIVETELERCVLNVYKNSVNVTVQANTKIIDRATGKIVWENWESDTIPVGSGKRKVKVKKRTESTVLTALQLASLSKREINACVSAAAVDVGREMGETFRDDLAESRQ